MSDRLPTLELEIDSLQTALAVGYTPTGLVGHEFLPVYRTGARQITAPKYNADTFRIADDKRALRAEPKEVSWTVSHQEATLVEHALQSPLDPQEIASAEQVGIDARSRARATAQRMVALGREKQIADLLQATGSYAAGNFATVASGSGWNEKTSGVSNVDPVEVVDGLKEVIRGKTGVKPNYMLINTAAWNALKYNTNITARLPGGSGGDDVKLVTKRAVQEMFEVEKFIVAESVYSTDSATFTDIWSDNCILAYINPTPTEVEEPTFGFTLTRQFGVVEGDIPLMGLAGSWMKHQWAESFWYMEERLPWIALNTAGYLLIDVVK